MNNQPIEKPVKSNDGSLEVFSIYDTIQGEGPFVGIPSVFIRLTGCNLQCPKCDTDYTSARWGMKVGAIVSKVQQFKRQLVVITGGEPFRQDIRELVSALLNAQLNVQIETNGTLPPTVEEADLKQKDFPTVTLVCSPKTPKVHPLTDKWTFHWKYVIEEGKVDPKDGLPTSSLGMPTPPARPIATGWNVYLSPLDSGDAQRNKENLEAAVESCMKFNYRLSPQIHKIAGLP